MQETELVPGAIVRYYLQVISQIDSGDRELQKIHNNNKQYNKW